MPAEAEGQHGDPCPDCPWGGKLHEVGEAFGGAKDFTLECSEHCDERCACGAYLDATGHCTADRTERCG